MAVGPGVATDWKLNLIEDLYRRTRRYFDSGNLPGSPDDPEIENKLSRVRQKLDELGTPIGGYDLMEQMPLSMLSLGEPEDLAVDLDQLNRCQGNEASFCTCKFDPHFNSMRYTLIHREDQNSIGTFARVTGAFSTCGLEILRAQIEMVGSFAWDNFWVSDPDFPDGDPPQARRDEVCQTICRVVDSPEEPLPPQRRTWAQQRQREPDSVNVLPSKVVFDNETVDRYTILSVFAYDHSGLLYRIAAMLGEKKVVLHFAKIDTHLDQIADVFYVSEVDGSKIVNSQRRREIREALLDAVS